MRIAAVACVFLLFLSGCNSSAIKPQSGFMSSYDGFRPHPTVEGADVWTQPGSDLSIVGKYDKFILAPTEIWYKQTDTYQGISPNELKAVTDYFESAVRRELDEDNFTSIGGPNVAVVRSAITGVKRASPERSALGYIPIALLISAGKNAVDNVNDMEVTVITASLEVEIYDSVTGERVAALMDQKVAGESKHEVGKGSFDQIKEVIDLWAKRFKTNLEKARS